MNKTNKTTRFLFGASALAATLLLASCAAPPTGPAAPAGPAAITIKGADFSFEGPESVPAGLTTINFQNAGKEWHHVQFARLNDGVSFQQAMQAFEKEGEAAMRLLTFVGGVAALDPGGNGSITLNLAEGEYMLMDFIPSADGVPHMAKGMLKSLTVTGAASAATVEPKADVTVNLKDFHFTLPAEVKAGKQVWKIINDGPQPHEIAIIKLAEGKTIEDGYAWFAKPEGPQPFQLVGGMQALNTGVPAAFINLDLSPGNYVATCDIPDPASGKPHSELGMVMPFTVK
jgi:hypothetical protein